jgi:hypothetical protein
VRRSEIVQPAFVSVLTILQLDVIARFGEARDRIENRLR